MDANRSNGVRLGLAAAIAVGALLRLVKLPGTSLAYDGLQSVTHAVRGVPLGIFSALFLDPHPPGFYVLLGGWTVLGTSDATVLMLTVLLSLALVPSAFFIGRAHFGVRAGLVAAFVCALHPLALYWSHHARMYALLMPLALWAWHFNLRLLEPGPWRWRTAAGVALTQLGLIYSHIAGPFFVGCVALAALAERRPARELVRRWLKLQLPLALAATPTLLFLLTKSPAHMRAPDLAEVWSALSVQLNGVDEPTRAWIAAGATGFLLLTAALLARARSRAFAICLLVLPFAAAGLWSHVARPIWHAPRLFAFVMPFVALGIGRLAGGSRTGALNLGGIAAAVSLALVLRGGLAYTLGHEKLGRFRDAAEILSAEARTGDRVLVPSLKDEWAIAWYLTGPEWARAVWTEGQLEALRQMLDPKQRSDFVRHVIDWGAGPGPEVPGVVPASTDEGGSLAGAGRIWVLTRHPSQRDALLARYELGDEIQSWEPGGLQLTLREGRGSR